MTTFVWAHDAGHEWLAVKLSYVVALKIKDKISSYSYVKGNTVYLEGDCDAAVFFDAYRAQFGKDPATRMGKNWDRWPGRSFEGYSPAYVDQKYPFHA